MFNKIRAIVLDYHRIKGGEVIREMLHILIFRLHNILHVRLGAIGEMDTAFANT